MIILLLTFLSFVIVEDSLSLDLDHLPLPTHFNAFADLVHAPSFAYRRVERQLENELRLQSLSDRVAELEILGLFIFVHIRFYYLQNRDRRVTDGEGGDELSRAGTLL
ncbi:hypothetical protein AAZX31_11G204100 [Glycine max]